MNLYDEVDGMCKETVMAYYEILSLNLLGRSGIAI
jgi:hypothetical protein